MQVPDSMATADLDIRRRRALWRATHRGTKELDHLIGRYAESHLPQMPHASLERFEAFLSEQDPVLQAALLAPTATNSGEFGDIIRAVRAFHGLV